MKLRAIFVSITTLLTSTPDSCSILIAAANDLVDGQQHYLRCIRTNLGSTKMVVVHSYSSPRPSGVLLNQKEHWARMYEEWVDFNPIGRRLFTSHGMQLRVPGKRLIKRLVMESLIRVVVESDLTTPGSVPKSQYGNVPTRTAWSIVVDEVKAHSSISKAGRPDAWNLYRSDWRVQSLIVTSGPEVLTEPSFEIV